MVGRKLGSPIVLTTNHGGAFRYNLQANNATRIQKDNDPNLVQGLSLCGQFLFIFGISTLTTANDFLRSTYPIEQLCLSQVGLKWPIIANYS